MAPEDCLFYLSWAGTASPDPKSTNQTEQLLAEPEVQNFFVQIDSAIRQMIEKQVAGQKAKPEEKELCRDVLEAWLSAATHPGAIFLSKLEFKKTSSPKAAKNGPQVPETRRTRSRT